MSNIYDRLCNEREIDVGFCCESCLTPLEDSPPLAEDWRVPQGRTKRLCPTCAEAEDLNGAERITPHIAANHRGDDPDTIGQTPCTCYADLEDAREIEMMKEIGRKAGDLKRHVEAMKDELKELETDFTRMFGTRK